MRRGLVLLAVAAVALVVPGSALAHVTLISSEPITQSRVDTPPIEVRLRFSQPVTITSNAVQVLAPDGTVLSGTARTDALSAAAAALSHEPRLDPLRARAPGVQLLPQLARHAAALGNPDRVVEAHA